MPIAQRSLSNQRIWLGIVLGLAAVALSFVLISRAHPLPEGLLRGARWALVAALVVYASLRRSLMTWIFACMVIGGINSCVISRPWDATYVAEHIVAREDAVAT